MALREETLFGTVDKVQIAIQRLCSFEPREGYYLAFSGGKDSQCIYHLAKMAGVKFDAHYSVTGVDPPELMRFIQKHYPDVEWDHHEDKNGGKPLTMWGLIASHTIPPTRQARYCCSALKESGGGGRVVVTGVRWAESNRRKAMHGVADIQTQSKKLQQEALDTNGTSARINKNGGIIFMDDNAESREMVERCYSKRKTTVNPIVDWTDEDVWEFLNDVAQVPHCSLYDEGLTRIGCIGCPLAGRNKMLADFKRWPRYKELYIRAFDKMIANHPGEIKVADGEMAISGGGGYSSEHGSTGAHDASGELVSELGELRLTSAERERDGNRDSTSGRDAKSTTSGYGAPDRKRSEKSSLRTGLSRTEEERARATGTVVADADGGGELRILDKQLLSGEAANTHTARAGEDILRWWIWMLREQRARDEPNPISRERNS